MIYYITMNKRETLEALETIARDAQQRKNMISQYLAALIGSGVNPYRIFYISLEAVNNKLYAVEWSDAENKKISTEITPIILTAEEIDECYLFAAESGAHPNDNDKSTILRLVTEELQEALPLFTVADLPELHEVYRITSTK